MKIQLTAAFLALSFTLLATSAQAIYHRDTRIVDIDTLLPLSDTSAQLRSLVSGVTVTPGEGGHDISQNASTETNAVNDRAIRAN